MKLNVLLVEEFPHPPEKVWRALTDREALRIWLMDNDFEPRVGKRFILRGRQTTPEFRGWSECEVLEMEPRRRMVWSWISNENDPPGRVEFSLEQIENGTRLTLSHTGEMNPVLISRLTEGWPGKLADLRAHLTSAV
jgi:uncharacterized protein YndB with AHSA1/START domain